jgi:hypothetical protein
MITNGSISGHHLVWGQAMANWSKPKEWLAILPNLQMSEQPAPRAQQLWHFALNGQSVGPLSRTDLVGQLKLQKNCYDILLWSKGMRSWTPLIEFYDLMDELGLNRRQYPRATINGRIVAKWDDKTAIGTLKMIGEGGFGAVGLTDVSVGQFLSVELHSPQFHEPLYVKAEVRSIDPDGNVGCRFIKMSIEFKSTIIQYVRQAQHPTTKAA